jgi:hypothetical protein
MNYDFACLRVLQIARLVNCETRKHFSLPARLLRLALIFSREASLNFHKILARKIAKRDSLSTLLAIYHLWVSDTGSGTCLSLSLFSIAAFLPKICLTANYSACVHTLFISANLKSPVCQFFIQLFLTSFRPVYILMSR